MDIGQQNRIIAGTAMALFVSPFILLVLGVVLPPTWASFLFPYLAWLWSGAGGALVVLWLWVVVRDIWPSVRDGNIKAVATQIGGAVFLALAVVGAFWFVAWFGGLFR